MIKKLLYWLFSIISVILILIVFIELVLQAIPVIYSFFPISKDKTYVYVIGESSAYGHPYMGKINFSKIIAETFNWNIDNKKIEIINFAEPGSKPLDQYQRYSFYRYKHPFKKGMVLIYMLGTNGNIFDNDFANKKYEKYNKFIVNSMIFSWIHPYFCKTFNLEYYYNILTSLFRKFKDEVYIATVVGNYSGVMPNNVEPIIKNNNLRRELNDIDKLIMNSKYEYSLQKIDNIVNNYEDKSQIFYRVGKIYEKQDKIEEANEIYRTMICDSDARPTIKENEMIRNLANKYSFELVDIEKDLINRNEIIGYNYFIDIVHPTINFNMTIAKMFIDKIKNKHFVVCNTYDVEERILGKLSNKDLFTAYRDALGEIFFYSYRDFIFDPYNKSIISKYINKLYELHSTIEEKSGLEFEKREEIIHICEILFECIQGNREKTIDLIKKYDLKNSIFRRDGIYFETRMQAFWYLKHWLIHFINKNNI